MNTPDMDWFENKRDKEIEETLEEIKSMLDFRLNRLGISYILLTSETRTHGKFHFLTQLDYQNTVQVLSRYIKFLMDKIETSL